MSTGTQSTNKQPPTDVAKQKPTETIISYVPLGESDEIHLSISRVKQFLCTPTKSGVYPSDAHVMKFIMMCKAQSLNPWQNDAFLVGYDGRDGAQFSLITAHQALLKRAEASKEFDGMESGVIVESDGKIIDRPGDLMLNGENLVGGWARVHRKDRSVTSYDAVNFSTFNTGLSRWKADPAGQIVKVAEASALRKAFPSTLAAMYCKEEMDRHRMDDETPAVVDNRSATQRLTDRVTANLSDRSAESQTFTSEVQTHEPEKLEIRRQEETQQQSRQEDSQEQPKEQETPQKEKEPTRDVTNSRADNLSRRIHLATAAKDLAQLSLEVGESLSDGGLSQHEADALTGLINEKMPK
jgi:phage recombination protein Bet